MRWLALGAALSLCACQTTYVAHTRQVRALVAQEKFSEAAEHERDFSPQYGQNDRILALLNQGALLHDAGKFPESNACLLEVEDRLADFYRRSAGGEVARSVLSGTSGDFLAEDYERILVHVYAIENYLALGQHDDALVEVRRMTGKLGVLADVKGHGRRYQGDGFAQWLSGLLYEDDRAFNDALIAHKTALAAYPKSATTPELRSQLCADAFRTAREARIPLDDVTGCSDADAKRPDAQPLKDDGEIVLLHALGQVSERTQKKSSCGFLPGGALWCYDEHGEQSEVPSIKLVSIATPELQPVPFDVRGAKLDIDGSAVSTAVVEDVDAIAQETLADRLDEYRREATTRALARLAGSTGAGIGAGKLVKGDDGQKAAVGILVGALANAALSEAEEADKRSWFTLPAAYGMARVRLPPGKHHVRVELQDGSGRAVRTVDFGDVVVTAGHRTWLGVRSGR